MKTFEELAKKAADNVNKFGKSWIRLNKMTFTKPNVTKGYGWVLWNLAFSNSFSLKLKDIYSHKPDGMTMDVLMGSRLIDRKKNPGDRAYTYYLTYFGLDYVKAAGIRAL